MIPVLTPEQMGEVDSAASEEIDVLIARAGSAVARAAVQLLGGTYGRRVVVVAGPGNNGNDGRVAAEGLRRRGVRTTVLDVATLPLRLPECDLVIDAAFGTGFHGEFDFPDASGAPVLAVDIPSGVDGSTGRAAGRPARANATITFAALKPGLVLGSGPALAGEVVVADIGLDVTASGAATGATMGLVEDSDLAEWVPVRGTDDHKWAHAVWLVAGSAGMGGAARLCSSAAMRAGSGYVRLSTPGDAEPHAAVEVVVHPLAEAGWSDEIVSGSDRFAALAIGPGLGRSDRTVEQARSVVARLDAPLVVDGDALWALGPQVAEIVSRRSAPTVLTPHDGEYARLVGEAPGVDRIAAARALAAACACTVLLKGPTTVVADADGSVLLVRAGDQRLATAGTGDVLTGIVAAHLSLGMDPLHAASAAAHLHGLAAMRSSARGMVASDLPDCIPECWTALGTGAATGSSGA